MNIEKLMIERIPAILYGNSSNKVFLFVHGKLGHKEEAEVFAELVCEKGWQVLSVDLPGHGAKWHYVPTA